VSDLKLTDMSGQLVAQSSGAALRFGRDPDSSVVVRGEAARVASVRHAELRLENGTWLLADLASKNGTFLNGTRVSTPTPVKQGDVIRLGESGPEYRVDTIGGQLEETLAEHPGIHVPSREAEQRAYGVTLLMTTTGKRFEARGTRIRLGRGRECEVQPVESNDTTVSRVHAEMTVGAGGGLVVRDVESKNGTYLNGERIAKPMPIRLGDKIMLGQGGPVLLVEGMGTAPQKAVPRPQAGGAGGIGQRTLIGMIGNALAKAKDEVGKDARGKIRWLTGFVVVLVILLGGGVYGVYWLLSRQVEHTKDSSRVEAERLRHELAAARAAAAPASEVETLRVQLAAAESRTTQLQAALDRAQQALGQQLAVGEARREEAQRDVQRMRDQLAAAERRAPSQGLIDSLRRSVTAAEAQAASLDAKMRAIRGTDFAGLAQQNQGAVGLITASFGGDRYDGTGFVISPDGYMLTNWHVVADSAHAEPDTVWVTMADQASGRYADVDDGRDLVPRDGRSDSIRWHDDGRIFRESGLQCRRRRDFGASGGASAGTGIRAVCPGEIRHSTHAAGAAPAARRIASSSKSPP